MITNKWERRRATYSVNWIKIRPYIFQNIVIINFPADIWTLNYFFLGNNLVSRLNFVDYFSRLKWWTHQRLLPCSKLASFIFNTIQKLLGNFQTIPFVEIYQLTWNPVRKDCSEVYKIVIVWKCWAMACSELTYKFINANYLYRYYILQTIFIGFTSLELIKHIVACTPSFVKSDKRALILKWLLNITKTVSIETIPPVNRWYEVMIYSRTFIIVWLVIEREIMTMIIIINNDNTKMTFHRQFVKFKKNLNYSLL